MKCMSPEIENNQNDAALVPDMSPICFDPQYDTRIILLRHGQSIGNADFRFLGHTDLDLSPLGYEQAKRTCELLKNEKIDAVYSSPLIRAYNTALPHAQLRGIAVNKDRSFIEMYAGEWENLLVDEIKERYGDMYTGPWKNNFGTFTIPGGEDCDSVRNRFYSGLEGLAKAHRGQTVLVGSHAAAIRCVWGKICGIEPEALAELVPFPYNASVSVVYYNGDALVPGVYSYKEHLIDLLV